MNGGFFSRIPNYLIATQPGYLGFRHETARFLIHFGCQTPKLNFSNGKALALTGPDPKVLLIVRYKKFGKSTHKAPHLAPCIESQ